MRRKDRARLRIFPHGFCSQTHTPFVALNVNAALPKSRTRHRNTDAALSYLGLLEISAARLSQTKREEPMSSFKSLIVGAALAVTVVSSAFAAGVDVNATPTGLALQGYDPVAYHTVGEPTKGDFQITSTYNEATYRFASEENKAKFDADPAAYAPQYGGYCAFGTAMGFKFDGDPTVWKIVDGELFLNLATGVQQRWEKDIPGFIEKADANWVDIEDKDPAELQQ